MKERLAQIPTGKIVAVALLYLGAIIITAAGIVFSVISVIGKTRFSVLSAQVPGFVFGIVIAFLGVRYFISVQRLKREVFKTQFSFSWSNFKKY